MIINLFRVSFINCIFKVYIFDSNIIRKKLLWAFSITQNANVYVYSKYF